MIPLYLVVVNKCPSKAPVEFMEWLGGAVCKVTFVSNLTSVKVESGF